MTNIKNNTVLKTINERYSGQGLLMSTVPTTNLLSCFICKQKYDNQHYPCIVCKNNHLVCKKCIQTQSSSRTDLRASKNIQKSCPQCQQKYSRQTVKPFQPYYQLCQYIRRFQQISKKQQMRFQLKNIQAQQVNKLLKKQNGQLKKWIKQVSEKLRQLQIGKKWNSSKSGDFIFQLPGPQVKNSQFEIIDGLIKKNSIGSFSNVVGLQPFPKNGVHIFTIKLQTSLSGGSILYGVCTAQARTQRFPWLTQQFIGYSGNDGDVISSGSWSNASTIYYDGKKVRAGDEISTIVDMNSKIINWRINSQYITQSYVIPQHMRSKLLYPIIIIQDGDRIKIMDGKER